MAEAPDLSIPRRLFNLAAPIIGLNVLNVMTLVIDTVMCGYLPESEAALTALGFATQVVFLLLVAMMGLSVGTVALVARAYGARNTERVNHLLAQATMLTVLVSIGVAAGGNLLAEPILHALGARDDITALGLAFLRPLLTCTMFYYLNILYGSVLRGVGNTRLPFMVSLASTALNVFLNYGFILGNMGFPALGVAGAAWGTVLSQAFGATCMIVLLRRGAIENLHLPLKPRRIDVPLAREIFRVGAPAALDMVIINAAFLSIVGMIARVEQVAVAAHGIGLRIQSLAFVPGMSVSQATGAMVGHALGAGDRRQADQVVRASLVLCTAIMTTIAIVIVLLVHPIVALFDVRPGTPIGDLAVTWIRMLGYGMPAVGIHIAFVGMLQGSGSTRTSLAVNALATLLFQVPLSAILGFVFDLGAFGIWISFPLSFVVRALLCAVAYKRGTWAKLGARAA